MSDAVIRSHNSRCWKRSTASSCIRTMKFSQFIAATSRWSSVVSASASFWVQVRRRLDVGQQLHPRPKEPGAEGNAATDLDPLRMLAKKVEVETAVEDAEVLLVIPWSEQIGAQSRAAPDHLPELDPRVDRLKEDQVGHRWHVDAGIEHVHGDCDVRRFVLPRESSSRLCGYVA